MTTDTRERLDALARSVETLVARCEQRSEAARKRWEHAEQVYRDAIADVSAAKLLQSHLEVIAKEIEKA